MPAAIPFIPVIAAIIGGGMAMSAANKKAKSDMEIAKMNQASTSSTANGPTVMPLADGAAVQAAKRKSILDQISDRGRASTLLSDPSNEKLGG